MTARGCVSVWEERCSTCIFRPGNLMRLRPGRLAEVVTRNRETGSLLMCHKTTHGAAPVEVVCRGYFDAYGEESAVVQIMTRMFGAEVFRSVPLEEDVV